MHTIYALVDPFDGRVRYVGRTTGGIDGAKTRLRGHQSARQTESTSKAKWLTRLAEHGVSPIVIVLQETDDEDVIQHAEREWIAAFEATGTALFNRLLRSTNVCATEATTFPTDISKRLRLAVALARLSCRQVDDLAGLAHGITDSVQSGRRPNPTVQTFAPLCEVLGLSIDWLLTGVGHEPTRVSVGMAIENARGRRRTGTDG